ncbi:hypothetical protein [Pseudoxanthomonas winnipegensis]|uniref:Uncharacterized protein n=1 Tax=Pseudoxanthomonas winnipegensis TaxID=2480810 RepID=A0A4Q8LER9_9GAMM|nr:hypothetical protein [Pseudoxanthomonas winnipegensis]RZZ81074.1 hypothetical protein EA662_18980 [Pseudoxanthomonas winnipegensis]TAA27706.1 hypothetical protein EA661_13240 [Pseudoxanthomonas winnipegensis]TAA42042.1 hypothetical protein EAT51_07100 [Pseudoxanthomonas winnipegensis]TBV70652.1 hypothetical protein EYC46_18315 [Pseudoxanthomonas winnipegensis]
MSIGNAAWKLLAAATVSATATAVDGPEIVTAPQALEYLSISHMAENFGFSLPVLLMVVAGALVGAWNSYHDKRSNLAITFAAGQLGPDVGHEPSLLGGQPDDAAGAPAGLGGAPDDVQRGLARVSGRQ